ncbi:hypothetical protein Cgig2_001882 [Carnegiea gigantea]|uniref:FAD-binding PCMH-type domain-containing protein n=1 Tax=Carnegiea gigantea TaxID=171969 RepID=A0A9Q1JZY7_9CARY|nr:hypothetical protein Cgig2_001882 [Carnegiea gigantea]
MANRIKPILAGACRSLSSVIPFAVVGTVSCSNFSNFPNKLSVGAKNRRLTNRRLVLGIGVSSWIQFITMFGAPNGSSFLASARQKSGIEEVLKDVQWPEQFPFKDEDFQRFDESSDSLFYESPRFVTHIDDYAIAALTKYYSEVFPPSNTPGVSILDMCSSWVSHFPKGYKQERIVGMGLNAEELARNPVLTEYIVQDLNANPKLPFEDNSFDVITNVVSVDYLTKPIEVFKEMYRILKPGGLAIMSFSNRCFWTKAISIWTSTSDAEHVLIVGAYFHYAGGFEPPRYNGFLILTIYASWASADSVQNHFLQCLYQNTRPEALLPPSWYIPTNSSFSYVLNSTGQNLRYVMPSVRKPELILMPTDISHIQAAVVCAKKIAVQLRVRSGGHDYEGVSYASEMQDPFMIIDMAKLRTVTVDIEDNSAWVEAGATIGELYYRISEESKPSMTQKGNKTVLGLFNGLFLGHADQLLKIMQHDFPELGLGKSDLSEMSWIESVLYIAQYPSGSKPEVLLEGKSLFKNYFKAKSDFVKEPIPESGLEGIWKRHVEDEGALMIWNPYGGMMSKIPESHIPFPHRNGTKFMIQYVVTWQDGKNSESRHMEWIRKLYNYMTPYVSMLPRQAYINYRDLDLGMTKDGDTNFIEASAWGHMYFKDNFYRLVKIKTEFDPRNFFRHEQSIPPLPVMETRGNIQWDPADDY